MAPDRTILHLVKNNPRPPPPLKNYGVHTIKPQLRECVCCAHCSVKDIIIDMQHVTETLVNQLIKL